MSVISEIFKSTDREYKGETIGEIRAREKKEQDKPKGDPYVYSVFVDKGLIPIGSDSNGFSDPYVVIKTIDQDEKEKQIYRSKVCKKTLEPQWKERGTMKIKYKKLKIELWDQDLLSKNDFIGSNIIEIGLTSAQQKFEVDMYFESDGRKNLKGRVWFCIDNN